jgi:hypothetical protein
MTSETLKESVLFPESRGPKSPVPTKLGRFDRPVNASIGGWSRNGSKSHNALSCSQLLSVTTRAVRLQFERKYARPKAAAIEVNAVLPSAQVARPAKRTVNALLG